ncbi:DUF4913 domain-containing protein [Streptomyces sp. NPDC093111]|uniref:DUF4913 domain-containing protein n=1 Tax=Streptomyces sp. NPDC093111 TaxID=3154978 RepID=UPI0034245E97
MTDPQQTPDEENDGLVFDSLERFVAEYVTEIVRRPVDGRYLAWCDEWWRHPEAIVRFSGMWRAFEYLRRDPALGMSNWWLHHADPHLAMLMDTVKGPFALCTGPDGHSEFLGPLPHQPAEPGMLDHPAFSVAAEDAPAAAQD